MLEYLSNLLGVLPLIDRGLNATFKAINRTPIYLQVNTVNVAERDPAPEKISNKSWGNGN